MEELSPSRTTKECTKMLQKGLRNPVVRFLRKHMEKAGCPVGNNFFKISHCGNYYGGFYGRGYGITVCCDKMETQNDVNEVLIHELIHAFDDCRAANLDGTNCAHHACSEIRAYHLSGGCHYNPHHKPRLFRGFMKSQGIQGHGQECMRTLRRCVLASLSANPSCSGSAARDSMEAAWDVCYNDTQPFDKASVWDKCLMYGLGK